jgi:hypothetical protein
MLLKNTDLLNVTLYDQITSRSKYYRGLSVKVRLKCRPRQKPKPRACGICYYWWTHNY